MPHFTLSKGSLKEMIYSERDFYSVSKPIFSYYCLKERERESEREREGSEKVGDGWEEGVLSPPPPFSSLNAAMQLKKKFKKFLKNTLFLL